MTTNLNVKYKKPIPTGDDVTIEARARVKQVKRNFVFIEAFFFVEILYQCLVI